MVNAETNLLRLAHQNIADLLPQGTTVIELGPGTETAFQNKTLPLLRNLNSTTCYLIDESSAFLQKITTNKDCHGLNILPVIDNFFETEDPYYHDNALVCSFGSTISNFEGPIDTSLPQKILMNGLSHMSKAARNGWMMIGFDSDHDGDKLIAFYKTQRLFQLNIFYRIAADLKNYITGDYDANAFIYEPEWISTSGQLAHIAVATHDMSFHLGGTPVIIKNGQKLHIKNSYKFTSAFFETCCNLAGLEVIQSWSNNSPAKIYLLKILPKQNAGAVAA